MNAEPILFYRTTEEYGCFSNFSLHGIEWGGYFWKTSEHLFQAMKFLWCAEEDPQHFHAVRNAFNAREAAEIGRDRSRPLDPEWESKKDDYMYFIIKLKAEQHSEIKKALLSTGERQIIEHSPTDGYWGDGYKQVQFRNGKGKNMLGKLWMELREEYNAA